MKSFSGSLLFLALFVAITAIAGGAALIVTNGLGMPLSWLDGSPFNSYILPGLLLLLVVGGTHIAASVAQWKHSVFAPEISEIAGFGLLIWIFTELYITHHTHWLQFLYFGIAILTLKLAYLQTINQELYGNTT